MALQPFLASRTAATDFSGGASQPAASGTFQRLFAEPARNESRDSSQQRLEEAKVDVIEENGRVASIVVTCRCCERIELACQY